MLILGGGPAGVACALRLATAGARVLLLERRLTPGFKPGEILDPAARAVLHELSILDNFDELGFPRSAGTCALWDGSAADTPGFLDAHGPPVTIDRPRFEDWLLDQAELNGVAVVRGASHLTLNRSAGEWTCKWRDGAVRAGTLVDASGRSGDFVACKQRLDADRHIALLAYPPAPREISDTRLHVEATDDGWWYAALLPKRRLVIAFVTDRDGLPVGASRASWFAEQTARTHLIADFARPALGGLACERIRGCSASSSICLTIDGPGWFAVGEAAASYDPLTGKGVALALAKGAAAARLLIADEPSAGARYASAERDTFSEYLSERRRTYGRGSRTGAFWATRLICIGAG